MGKVAFTETTSEQLGSKCMQDITLKDYEAECTHPYPSDEECKLVEESKDHTNAVELLDKGYMQYG